MKKTAICYCSSISKTKVTDELKDIYEVKLKVAVNDEEFQSGDISQAELFDLVTKHKAKAVTSQPARQVFEDLFKELLNEYDQIICITPAPSLSGTHDSALKVATDVSVEKIIVIDSSAIGMTEAILVEEAAKLLKTTDDLSEIRFELEKLADRLVTYAVPGSLNYLKYSGRVDLKALIIGTMLNINILIKAKGMDVGVHSRSRGYKSVLKSINQEIDVYNPTEVYYSSILESQEKQSAILELFERRGIKVTLTHPADIITSAHFGPDSFGFTFIV